MAEARYRFEARRSPRDRIFTLRQTEKKKKNEGIWKKTNETNNKQKDKKEYVKE